VEKKSLSFVAVTKDQRVEFKLNLSGRQNIANILAAILAAQEFKMSLKEIALACQKIKPEQGGINILKGAKGLNIIDSTYSANPDGVLADLDYLNLWEGKKVIIMPCLIELGQDSKKIHKKIGREIGKVCDLSIVTTKERFKDIKAGAREEGMKENNIIFMENPQEIFRKVIAFLTEGGTILLESRVPGKLINLLTNKNES
jgi:UDP-N-acetylmuramyl pentapeptide synthase